MLINFTERVYTHVSGARNKILKVPAFKANTKLNKNGSIKGNSVKYWKRYCCISLSGTTVL